MRPPVSKVGVVVLAFALVSSGCLSGGGPEASTVTPTPTATPPGTPTPTETPPVTPTPTATSPTPQEWTELEEKPYSDQPVQVENRWNQTVTMSVRVIRHATNTTVHNNSYQVTPGTDRTVYNIAEAQPNGIEVFTVAVTARNTTMRTTIETDKCHRGAFAEVQQDGSLYVDHVIC